MVGGTVSEVVRVAASGLPGGRLRARLRRLAGIRRTRCSQPGPFGPRKLDPKAAPISTALGRARHAGHDRLRRPARHRPAEARRDGRRLGGRRARWARRWGRWPRSRAAARSAWPAAEAKCDYVVKELGFDACVNYKRQDVFAALKAPARRASTSTSTTSAARCSNAVLRLDQPVRAHPASAGSSRSTTPPSSRAGRTCARSSSTARTVRGFIVCDHVDRLAGLPRATAGGWVREGQLKYREDIVEGLENAPRAFIGLLRGENFGKLLVRVGPTPRASRSYTASARSCPSGRTGRSACSPALPSRSSSRRWRRARAAAPARLRELRRTGRTARVAHSMTCILTDRESLHEAPPRQSGCKWLPPPRACAISQRLYSMAWPWSIERSLAVRPSTQ